MSRCKIIGGAALCAAAGLWIGGGFAADAVTLDFSQARGPVKPVNGVGQPPMIGALGNWSMLHYLKEAGIPYSRLHGVAAWPVEIANNTTWLLKLKKANIHSSPSPSTFTSSSWPGFSRGMGFGGWLAYNRSTRASFSRTIFSMLASDCE